MAHEQSFALFAVFMLMIAYGMYRTYIKGKLPHIRRLPALEAIDEGIGRALETGAKVHFGVPNADLARYAPATLLALTLMGYVAKKAAKAGVPALYTVSSPRALVIAEAVVREAYTSEGKLEDYENPEKVNVRYLGMGETAYPLALANLLQREKIATSVLSGFVGKNMLFLGESHREADTFSVLIYPEVDKVEFGVATFDYVLMAQEAYAAGALITKDKAQLGSIIGSDMISWTTIALVIVFLIIASVLGIPTKKFLVG